MRGWDGHRRMIAGGFVMSVMLTPVQDQAIAARMALIVGAETFDRLFRGIRFAEIKDEFLFVYAQDEGTAAEIEDHYSLHIFHHRQRNSQAEDWYRPGVF